MNIKRSVIGILAGITALGLLTACSGGQGDSNAQGGSDGLTEVTMGVIPIAINAPIHLGKSKGFFKENGIDLKIVNSAGGSAAIPALLGGDWDFSDGNPVSLMVARDKGLGVTAIAADGASSGDKERDTGAVIVPKDSPITSAAQLAGKRVSVNTLQNIGDTTIRTVVDQNGGDGTAVKFVEVPVGQEEAALKEKQVDASWVVEPFVEKAIEDGYRILFYNFVDFDPNLPIGIIMTATKFKESHPELTENFTKAMNKSLEYADSHPDEVRNIITTYTKVPPALVEKMKLNKWPTTIDYPAVQKLADAAYKYGTISKKVDVKSFLP